MAFAKLTILLAIFATSALAAQKVVPISDITPEGSPLRNFGAVTVAEDHDGENLRVSSSREWTVYNISPKAIVAVIESLEISYPSGYKSGGVEQYELFFYSELMKPGDKLSFSEPAGDVAEFKRASVVPGEPKSNAQVLWVQFADGSSFGDEKYAAALLVDRAATFREMSRLRDTFVRDGGEAFLREIQTDSHGSRGIAAYHEQLKVFYNQTKDIRGTYDKLNSWIETAESRHALLN